MPIPERVFAHAAPRSRGATSLFALRRHVTRRRASDFVSPPAITASAWQLLRGAGFTVHQVTSVSINISGPIALFEREFRTKIVETPVGASDGTAVAHLDSPDTDVLGLLSTVGTRYERVLEGVALETPHEGAGSSMGPAAPIAPRAPEEMARAMNATWLHRLGVTGEGVRAAVVDSGWRLDPASAANGFTIAPVVPAPGATDAAPEDAGHGTRASGRLLAIAPRCELLPVEMNPANTVAAFNAAVALRPDIIVCGWEAGSAVPTAADVVLSASIAAAAASGIVVVFAAGGGHALSAARHPDVIAAGGASTAPLLAGVAALMKQAVPLMTPPAVRLAMTSAARGMEAGAGEPPGDHLDAPAAVLTAYWASLSGAAAVDPAPAPYRDAWQPT